MKQFLGIAASALVVLLCGCDEGEDLFTEQQNGIVRYLTSTRGLIPETETGEVIEDNPAFYTELGRSAFRHIVTYYDAGREERIEAVEGSTLDLLFNAYIFGNSEPTLADVYWSNIGSTVSALESRNGVGAPLDWQIEPLTVTLGSTKMIQGLEEALNGCREQDSVQIYMTYNMAYGKNIVGTVPKNSPVAWYVKILKVTK